MEEKEKEKVIDIRGRFGREISNIDFLLRKLEEGRVYGYNGNTSTMDGSLYHNAVELRREIGKLLAKIEYGEKSTSEELREALSNIDI